jgi:PleD family two-component response regulator
MNSSDERAKILIVDDLPENIRMLMELLKDDYATIPATNGDAALKKIMEGSKPDLILLDIMMPGIDGYEVCRQLKASPESQTIPVIFISAISEVMDAAKAFELGAVDYITKPFNPATVKARVKTHIKLSRTMEELKDALSKVKTLSGLLPICSNCKKVRDDQGYWNQIEVYVGQHSEASFSHGVCPECTELLYPQMSRKKKKSEG